MEPYCSETGDAIEGGQPASGQGDALQEDIKDADEHYGSDGRHKSRMDLTEMEESEIKTGIIYQSSH